jgi:hypothetical protein
MENRGIVKIFVRKSFWFSGPVPQRVLGGVSAENRFGPHEGRHLRLSLRNPLGRSLHEMCQMKNNTKIMKNATKQAAAMAKSVTIDQSIEKLSIF